MDNLIDSQRKAAVYNRHDLAAPSVVLWTDGERLWSKVVPMLRDAMPELLMLAPEFDRFFLLVVLIAGAGAFSAPIPIRLFCE